MTCLSTQLMWMQWEPYEYWMQSEQQGSQNKSDFIRPPHLRCMDSYKKSHRKKQLHFIPDPHMVSNTFSVIYTVVSNNLLPYNIEFSIYFLSDPQSRLPLRGSAPNKLLILPTARIQNECECRFTLMNSL